MNRSKWNNYGLNATQCNVMEEDFRKISNCTNSKQAWDILHVVHEGTNTVYNSKIQRLTTDFKNIKMSNSESFLNFQNRLKDVCNSLYNLGEPISETIVQKILRSLPKKFVPKIITIKESKDLNSLLKNELRGSLQTFEVDILKKYSQPEEKYLAFECQLTKVDDEREEEDETGSIDENELALLAQNLNRYLRSFRNEQNLSRPNGGQNRKGSTNLRGNHQYRRQPGNMGNNNRLLGKDSKEKECLECHGYGHRAFECATCLNRVRRKTQTSQATKATYNSTLSDEEQGEESGKFVAFAAGLE